MPILNSKTAFSLSVALCLGLGLSSISCSKDIKTIQQKELPKGEKIDGEPVINNAESGPLFRTSNLVKGTSNQSDVSVDLKVDHLPSGYVEVSAASAADVFVTVDGTQPKVKDGAAQGTAFLYKGPLTLTKNTIVRAVGVKGATVSAVRSVAVLPRKFVAQLATFPQDTRAIAGVYVTGEFRNWSTDLTDAFKLTKQSDGSYAKTILIAREKEMDYKFIIQYADGGITWVTEPSQTEAQRGEHRNNVMTDPRLDLEKLVQSKKDGLIEEVGLKFDHAPVAALDAGENLVRLKLSMMEGDAESVSLHFLNGESVELTKTRFQDGPFLKSTYSGLVRLPETTKTLEYVFVAEDNGSQIAIAQNGLFKVESEGRGKVVPETAQFFPFKYDVEKQLLNGNDIYQIPAWAVDITWYQIFPERFRNGDTSNDLPGALPLNWNKAFGDLSKVIQKVIPWTWSWFTFTKEEIETEKIVLKHYPELSQTGFPQLQAQLIRNRRYGGDLRGIHDSIPYLKSLGVSGIYLNPVFLSDSEHKYDTMDYRHVDHRFGPMVVGEDGQKDISEADKKVLAAEIFEKPSTWGYTEADKEFMKLVTELQDNGIRVVFDGVFNHSATGGPLVQDIAKRGKESPYYSWFETSYEGDADYFSRSCSLATYYGDAAKYPFASKIRFGAWWGECGLINHREGYGKTVFHPQLTQYIYDVSERWLTPKVVDGINFRGVDGIRLDVYGDVDVSFWVDYRSKVKSFKRDALIIAEEWHDGYHYLEGDQADSLMNYTVRTLAESWFINVHTAEKFRPSQAKNFVDERMNNHREHVKYGLMSMLSSHDTDRMLSRTMLFNRGLTLRPFENNAWDHEINSKPDKGSLYTNDKPGTLERSFMKVIAAFQMSYVGAPNIYYGDEVGMWGADDPSDRKPMIWDDIAQGTQFETQCQSTVGYFCLERSDVHFTVEQDKNMLEAFKRFIQARTDNPALRRGKMNTSIEFNVDGTWYTNGDTKYDNNFLWGYERSYGGTNFAYFISNQNLAKERQSFKVKTRFAPNSKVAELITNKLVDVDANGVVSLSLDRDRGAFLVVPK